MASIYSLDDFEKELMQLAGEFQGGKQATKFIQSQGNKLNSKVKKSYKKNTEKRKKEVEKSFKRGKVYKYQGKDLSVRAYNSHPLAHLINDGFIHRGGKNKGGKETFVKGNQFLDKAKDEFEKEYPQNVSKWLDDLIEKGL